MSTTQKYRFEVEVSTHFLEEQSDPEGGPFVFAYTIDIRNIGEGTAQLLRRHWVITDAMNNVQEVRGDGVIGEQPVLRPGETFQYTSGCPLPTSVGTMKGEYTFVTEDGDTFEVAIPEFLLSVPHALH
ncbi:Co2+/Mg2+ efflux protein ApaG [Limnobacter litoralis]|uniref:Protein ApaG n=1 Tax=Limnobacter litoralis TaxID=481366 RepID=A0ABQ5YT12_9BURK|nr:Co2+/Mg2+ efflux protein ApaG [Limnobacter litoralis]GLR27284.1 protein ApaG [Limnobacter litoralis]